MGAADTRCIQTQTLCLALQRLTLKSSPRGPTQHHSLLLCPAGYHATCTSPDPPLRDMRSRGETTSCPWR